MVWYGMIDCLHLSDCLFDKGVSLSRPEIVPFRLTPNMVDAMGVTGYEGAFRCTMECCLSLLKQHRDTLLSVLEPFLRDPTVCWGRVGRAQMASGGEAAAVSSLQENATMALLKISERLEGSRLTD